VIDYDPDECAAFVSAWKVVVATRDAIARAQGVDWAGEWARQLGDELADREALIRARDGTRDPIGAGDPLDS
jgi:hypothetical protein